jgi:outer membrane lipopolysaccharide assembly protein LptE/RlpB
MKKNKLYAPLATLALLGLILITGGCSGYKLGNTLPPGVTSITIPVFINDTKEPNLETIVTAATIQEFQKDGSMKVVQKSQANSLLEVRIKKSALEPVRYRRDKAVTANEYRLTLTADVILRKLPGNEVMVNTTGVIGFTTFPVLSDLPSARRAALPKAAADLGQRIVKCVIEYW